MGLRLRENALDLLLLAGMLLSVAGSFIHAKWTWGLEALIWMAAGGLLAGFLLAQSIFRPRLAHTFSLIYGTIGVALVTSSLFPNQPSLRLRVIEMALRVWRWLETALRGRGQSSDNLVFVLQLAILTWWVSYIAAWFAFRRRQVWGILLPSGLLFFWNLYYSFVPLTGYLFTYLICGLPLVAHLTLRRRQEHWRQRAVSFNPEMGMDFLRYGMSFALGITALAWLIPPLTNLQAGPLIEWLPAEKVSVRIQREWQRLFAALEYHVHGPSEPFGMEITLREPVRIEGGPVLTIQAPPGRYYWRAVVYDKYTGQGWLDTGTELTLLEPFSSLGPSQEYALRQEVTQTITTHLPGTTMLFGASQPLRMSLPAKVYYLFSKEGPLPPSLWQSPRPLRPEQSYTVVSSISIASEEDLRNAGTDYPSWVRERYLQLPDSLPQRVIALAHYIAQGATNPYDQATALERYLRTIPYNELVPPPPADRDGVDYFLFSRREGYCTYYASAMAVMARALGIPARVATGYSTGEFLPKERVFIISRSNAHAWVEVFFPKYGWVVFEPTAAEPQIVRPRPVVEEEKGEEGPGPGGGAAGGPPGMPEDFLEEEYYPGGGGALALRRGRDWRTLARVIGFVMLVGMLTAGGWGISRWWIGRRFTPIAWAYVRLMTCGRWLNCPLSAGQTPHEYAQELAKVMPQAQPLIRRLIELYVAECFGQRSVTGEEAEQAWKELRPFLLRSWAQQQWANSPLPDLLRTLRRIFS